MADKKYTIVVVCSNCEYRGKVSILKGKLVKHTPCPRCGNKTLRSSVPGET